MKRIGMLWVAVATLLSPALAWADGGLEIEGKPLRAWVQEARAGDQRAAGDLCRALEQVEADPARAALAYALNRSEPLELRLHAAGLALSMGLPPRTVRASLEADTEFVAAACAGLGVLKERDLRFRLIAALGHSASAAEAELLALSPRTTNDHLRLGAIASVSSEGFTRVSSWARASSFAPMALGMVGREQEARAAELFARLVKTPPHYKRFVGTGVSCLPARLSASLLVEIVEQEAPDMLQGLDRQTLVSFDERQAKRFVAGVEAHRKRGLSFDLAFGVVEVLGAMAKAGNEDAIQLLVRIARTQPGDFGAARCARLLAQANAALGSRILAEIAPKQRDSAALLALSEAYAGKPGAALPGPVGRSTPELLRSLPKIPAAWIQELKALCMSGPPLQRIHAIRALAVVRASAARQAIAAATRDADPCVARAARIALKTRGAS